MRSKEVDDAIGNVHQCINTSQYPDDDDMETVLSYISELEEENAKYKNFQLHINGMRSGKELLIKYINDSVLKEDIRDKINNMFELYHERYELDFEEVRELISELHRKVLKELEGE